MLYNSQRQVWATEHFSGTGSFGSSWTKGQKMHCCFYVTLRKIKWYKTDKR